MAALIIILLPALVVQDPHLHAEVDVRVFVVARLGLIAELGADQPEFAVGHVVGHDLGLVPQLLHLVLQLADGRRRLPQLLVPERNLTTNLGSVV